jgi:hypothetical protein
MYLGYIGPSSIACLSSNTYLYLHHMWFSSSDLKCYGSVTQVLEIIFECKGKGVMKKQQEKKKSFSIYKTCFFFPFFLDLSYF